MSRTSTTRDDIITILKQVHLVRLAELQTALPEVDFSTIYRNVQQLEADGVVRKVVLDQRVVAYELASCHHDHFLCDSCQQVESVSVPRQGLKGKVVSSVLVRGQCVDCQDDESTVSV